MVSKKQVHPLPILFAKVFSLSLPIKVYSKTDFNVNLNSSWNVNSLSSCVSILMILGTIVAVNRKQWQRQQELQRNRQQSEWVSGGAYLRSKNIPPTERPLLEIKPRGRDDMINQGNSNPVDLNRNPISNIKPESTRFSKTIELAQNAGKAVKCMAFSILLHQQPKSQKSENIANNVGNEKNIETSYRIKRGREEQCYSLNESISTKKGKLDESSETIDHSRKRNQYLLTPIIRNISTRKNRLNSVNRSVTFTDTKGNGDLTQRFYYDKTLSALTSIGDYQNFRKEVTSPQLSQPLPGDYSPGSCSISSPVKPTTLLQNSSIEKRTASEISLSSIVRKRSRSTFEYNHVQHFNSWEQNTANGFNSAKRRNCSNLNQYGRVPLSSSSARQKNNFKNHKKLLDRQKFAEELVWRKMNDAQEKVSESKLDGNNLSLTENPSVNAILHTSLKNNADGTGTGNGMVEKVKTNSTQNQKIGNKPLLTFNFGANEETKKDISLSLHSNSEIRNNNSNHNSTLMTTNSGNEAAKLPIQGASKEGSNVSIAESKPSSSTLKDNTTFNTANAITLPDVLAPTNINPASLTHVGKTSDNQNIFSQNRNSDNKNPNPVLMFGKENVVPTLIPASADTSSSNLLSSNSTATTVNNAFSLGTNGSRVRRKTRGASSRRRR